jgi:hypothetical protein
MKALDLLATTLNRTDDKPNQALADEIIKASRKDWVQELVWEKPTEYYCLIKNR